MCPCLITLGVFLCPTDLLSFFTTFSWFSKKKCMTLPEKFSDSLMAAIWSTGQPGSLGLETHQEIRANGIKGVLTAICKNKCFRVLITMKKKFYYITTSIFTHWKTGMKQNYILAKVTGFQGPNESFMFWLKLKILPFLNGKCLNRIRGFSNGNRSICFLVLQTFTYSLPQK